MYKRQRLWLSEYILFAVAIAYFVATVVLLRRYHALAADTLSNFNPAKFQWLGVLVSFFVVTILTKAVMAFSNFLTMPMLVISDALIVLAMLLIALTQWKIPLFFQVGSQVSDPRENMEDLVPSEKNSGTLDKTTRGLMLEELITYIESGKSYRDSELSLTKLAESTGLSTHHLSEVLNQHAGKNFNQFINEYRINEVCERLRGANTDSILDIAIHAGFASKSTFNTIFKKTVGVTPSQYRMQYGSSE